MFQRVLMFLDPEFGSSVHNVYRLSRLYDRLSERSALVMLAAWRGSTMAVTRAKYRPALYDDERHRARVRGLAGERPAVQPGSGVIPPRFAGSAQAIRIAQRFHCDTLGLRQIEKMPPCPVLGLDDPGVGIEADFLGETLFHRSCSGTGCGEVGANTRSIGRLVVIDGLRRRRIQHGVAVEQRDLDEHRAGLLRAAPAHRAEDALGLAAAQIGRHPDG